MSVLKPVHDNVIDYHDESHTYWVDGKLVPSINQVADELLGGLQGIDPWYAKRGTAIHAACEILQLDRSKGPEDTGCDPEILEFVGAFHRFLDELSWESEVVEEAIWSKRYGITGRPDAIGRFPGGELAVMDLKSGGEYPRYDFCSAGYSILASEYYGVSIKERVYVYVKRDGTFRVKYAKRKSDFAAFEGYARARKWKENFGE